MPIIYSPIAQLVERMTVNHDVTGSSPVGRAIWHYRLNGQDTSPSSLQSWVQVPVVSPNEYAGLAQLLEQSPCKR